MANNKISSDNQLVLSPELLLLLEWLFEYEQEGLKKLIQTAYKHGLEKRLTHEFAAPSVQGAQQTVFDFFALVEALTHEVLMDQEEESSMQQMFIPAINHMDVQQSDSQALALSIDKATSALYSPRSKKNAKEVLCKEFLKNWKPAVTKKTAH